MADNGDITTGTREVRKGKGVSREMMMAHAVGSNKQPGRNWELMARQRVAARALPPESKDVPESSSLTFFERWRDEGRSRDEHPSSPASTDEPTAEFHSLDFDLLDLENMPISMAFESGSSAYPQTVDSASTIPRSMRASGSLFFLQQALLASSGGEEEDEEGDVI